MRRCLLKPRLDLLLLLLVFDLVADPLVQPLGHARTGERTVIVERGNSANEAVAAAGLAARHGHIVRPASLVGDQLPLVADVVHVDLPRPSAGFAGSRRPPPGQLPTVTGCDAFPAVMYFW